VATDTREEFEELFSLYAPVLVAAAAIVILVVLFALVRFRRGRGHAPWRRSEATIVEIVYALGLIGIVAVLVAATFAAEGRIDRVAAQSGLEVNVTAFKWGWRFDYPGAGVSVAGDDRGPPTAAVPTGATIHFSLRSRDVIHALWIPDLRFKRDAFPKFANEFDLVFARAGPYVGRCAEFCGLRHAGMSFKIDAMARDDFERWLEERAS
jgi:cytochrome c oxidase subunit 2